MNNLYTYQNYEECLYHQQYYKCIIIARYLLPKINNKLTNRLLEQINKVEYRWDLPQEDLVTLIELLHSIKVWLMVYSTYLQ